MGNSESSSSSRRHHATYNAPVPPAPAASSARPPPLGQSSTMRFRAIADNFSSIDGVQDALRQQGLESSNLIVAVDFTKSNEWSGKHSFDGRSLHFIGATPNPYEEAIGILGRTLRAFDDDGLIPCYGFGDVMSRDVQVFSFLPGNRPCDGLEHALARYRQLVPHVRLAGPTSFAPVIEQAVKVVIDSGCQYHILLIIADGQVTRASDTETGQMSPQEQATVQAITAASQFPLSIIMVGVGDGPFDVMKEFDDALPYRNFDNFQFVNFTETYTQFKHDPRKLEAMFSLRALMEIPEQFKIIRSLGILNKPSPLQLNVRPLEPPGPPPDPWPPASIRASSPGTSLSGAPAIPPPPVSPGATGMDADPALYLCPITQEIMTDPVLAADGYSYERSAIEQWLQNHNSSPMTNAPLPHASLIPNHALRSSIIEYRQRSSGRAL